MAGWLLWLVLACAFGAGEVLSGSSFYLAPFAIGALLAAAADAAIDGAASWIVFVATTVLSLAALRPLVQSRLLNAPALRTGAAALVGKQAMVLERIANHEGLGQVRIDSEVWSARAYDDECVIEPGTKVHVVEIRGATALVLE
jgi:membrane protein implicated in regulation of membrane protease activity